MKKILKFKLCTVIVADSWLGEVDRARGEIGCNWSNEDLVNICRLKLERNAAKFIKTVVSLLGEVGNYQM
jgi:hypothetical protein